MLLGDAVDGAVVTAGIPDQGDTASMELTPDAEEASTELTVLGAPSVVLSRVPAFPQLGAFEAHEADLTAGPFDDGDSEGAVRLLMVPAPRLTAASRSRPRCAGSAAHPRTPPRSPPPSPSGS